jgi:hypothetical protein
MNEYDVLIILFIYILDQQWDIAKNYLGFRISFLYSTPIIIGLDKDYSDVGHIEGLYFKNTRSTVKYKNMYGTDVPYRRTVPCVAVTKYNTVHYCTVSFVRPQRLRIAKHRHIVRNKKIPQGVSSRRRSAALKYLKGESFREGSGFFLGHIFYAHATSTSTSAEASVVYAA